MLKYLQMSDKLGIKCKMITISDKKTSDTVMSSLLRTVTKLLIFIQLLGTNNGLSSWNDTEAVTNREVCSVCQSCGEWLHSGHNIIQVGDNIRLFSLLLYNLICRLVLLEKVNAYRWIQSLCQQLDWNLKVKNNTGWLKFSLVGLEKILPVTIIA